MHEQSSLADQYGLFRNRSVADKQLRAAAGEHELCLKKLGLEKGRGPCFAYQLKRCRGACVGEEAAAQHDLRVAEALLPMRVREWPYAGPIGILEKNRHAGISQVLVFDRWRLVTVLDEGEELPDPLPQAQPLDLDTYKILQRHLASAKVAIVHLADAAAAGAGQLSWV